MNNSTHPTEPTIEGLQTPFCLTGEIDPRQYLSGLGQWPPLPTGGLRAVVPGPLKKLVGKLLADRGEAIALRDANDVAEARRAMATAASDGSDYGAIEVERIRRAISAMDLDGYGRAVTRLREIEAEGRAAALEFMPVAAQAKYDSLLAEAKDCESRLLRHGRTLIDSDKIEDGYRVVRWTLWRDEVLSGIFMEFWSLANLWPAEFENPRYENRDPLDWLAACVTSEG